MKYDNGDGPFNKQGMQNMTAYLKTSTTSLKIDNTVLQRQMAFCSGSSMEIKQLVTQEAMVIY